MAKTIRKNNFKIQMLAGNSMKSCFGASSQISTTLTITSLATGQISEVEYSLMDRWFNLNSKTFEKFVKPDIIGRKFLSLFLFTISSCLFYLFLYYT